MKTLLPLRLGLLLALLSSPGFTDPSACRHYRIVDSSGKSTEVIHPMLYVEDRTYRHEEFIKLSHGQAVINVPVVNIEGISRDNPATNSWEVTLDSGKTLTGSLLKRGEREYIIATAIIERVEYYYKIPLQDITSITRVDPPSSNHSPIMSEIEDDVENDIP